MLKSNSASDPLDRRRIVVAFGSCALAGLAIFAWLYGPTYVSIWSYSPREGDILFQSLPHSQLTDAIEGASESPLSHCGIVAKSNGEWVVYEAYRNVRTTPLREFIFRGRRHGFAVYRLRRESRCHIHALIEHAKRYLGRPYDVRYRMDDDQIYCTELINKAYYHASGQQLGSFSRLGDLQWQPFEREIMHYERGPIPLDRELITPKSLALDPQLELISAHRIAVPNPTNLR